MDNGILRDMPISKHYLNESHMAQNIQNCQYTFVLQDTGMANAYAISPSPPVAAYKVGQRFTFKAANSNTSSSTLSVSGLPPLPIIRGGQSAVQGQTLNSADIVAGAFIDVVLDGTYFQMMDGFGVRLDQFYMPSYDLNFNSKRLTNVSNPSGLQDAMSAIAVQQNMVAYCTDTGTADTYAIAVNNGPLPQTWTPGQRYLFIATHTCNAGANITISGCGTATLQKANGSSLAAGDIQANQLVDIICLTSTAIFQVMNPLSGGGGNSIYGDGSGGTVTISGNTTLSGIPYYSTLTVNSSIKLTSAYPIYCLTQCTVSSSGSINNNGGAGGNGTGSGGASGGSGGVGGFYAAGAAGGASASTQGSPGSSTSASLGAAGGAGGNGSTNKGSGGAVAAPVANVGGVPRDWASAVHGYTRATSPANFSGASGGGAGGGNGTAGGGSGGGGGGVLVLLARTITGTGSISANGGAGGNGASGGSNCGGGGGGGGGYCMVVSASSTITPTANGGAAGTHAGTGQDGTAGTNGVAISLQN